MLRGGRRKGAVLAPSAGHATSSWAAGWRINRSIGRASAVD